MIDSRFQRFAPSETLMKGAGDRHGTTNSFSDGEVPCLLLAKAPTIGWPTGSATGK
jgi:hypothetical protein